MTHTKFIIKKYDETVDSFFFPDHEAEKILEVLLDKEEELEIIKTMETGNRLRNEEDEC